jgi:hypothetical protein
MGATNIEVQGEGMSMSKARLALQEEARQEYGSDGYNGTISAISDWQDKTREYKASGLALEDFFDELLESLDKREGAGVCLREPVGEKPGLYAFAGWAPE